MKLDFADYRVTIAIVSVDLRAGYVRLSAIASCLMNIDVDQGRISRCLSTARSTLRHARFTQAVIDLLLLSDQLRALRSQETTAGRGLPRKGRGDARHAPPLAQDHRHDPIFPRRPLASQPTDFTAVMPMQTARLFEERDGIVAIPIHLGPESNRGRGAFNTRLIRHGRLQHPPHPARTRRRRTRPAVAARTLRGPRPPGGSEGEDRRIPCFQAQALQTGQDLRSST